MKLLLMEVGLEINATENEKLEFVLALAQGELKFSGICGWLLRNQLK
jgi:hypothetical protein